MKQRVNSFAFIIIMYALISTGCKGDKQIQSNGFDLQAARFDTVLNNKTTGLYFLKNAKGMEAAITNFGGRIVGLTAADRYGKQADVILGFNSIKDYLNANEVFHGALIGRVGNRIAKGAFTLDEVSYKLPLNNGINHLHGGTGGFHNQVWEVIEVTKNSIMLNYISKDGDMGYPGNLKVSVTYKLTDKNEFILNYTATTDKKTVVNLTSHPFFNLAGEGHGTINKHMLQINADNYTPVDSTLIPLGKNQPVSGTPFDFRKAKAIGEDLAQDNTNEQLKNGLGYDHNFVLNQPKEGKMFWAATITDPESGRSMEVHTTEPGLQFYGGNFMDGSDVGNSGRPYEFRESFALETQHFPDAPNQEHFPSIVLRPGEKYVSQTIYKFLVK